ncbi:MAG: ABC transporter ATP-binding protein [Sneathiella sp.]|nr:ABC transporter ATP-binding protein [Sneathiella sp.]
MALFEATHLHKRFGDQVVLEDVTLSFEEGQLSGIMGPNGAGKSTCFNVLTGHYKPNSGTVTFEGRDITGLAPRIIAGMGIARSFQIMNLFDEFSALENILVAGPQSIKRSFNPFHDICGNSEAIDKAESILARVGLKGKENLIASSLPYGERRALEIAVALASDPKLLFLDEPTQGLGADGTALLADLISELKRDYSIVIIEHNMNFLFSLADTISVIHWGQVIATGSPAELRENEWVKASSLGEVA